VYTSWLHTAAVLLRRLWQFYPSYACVCAPLLKPLWSPLALHS
jgi:hypothetical protein